MAKLKLNVHPLFVLFGFVVIYFGWFVEFLVYVGIVLMHELAHYFTARAYGYKLNKIVFMPYGASLSGNSTMFVPSHEVVVALAGPVLNFVLAVVGVALWWLFPLTYAYTQLFVQANLVLGIFNLLPIFPLDGGRILVAVLQTKRSKLKVMRAMKTVGWVATAMFCVLFVTSVFYRLNLTYLFIAVFLALSSMEGENQVYYERSYIKTLQHRPMELKTFVVSNRLPAYKLLKFLKGNCYTQFMVLNEQKQVVKTISEHELVTILEKNTKTNK